MTTKRVQETVRVVHEQEGIMKITVTPEGRNGVWLADKDSIIGFINQYKEEQIHNFMPGGGVILGVGWDKQSVIDEINNSTRIGILTGEALSRNMRHALSVISNNKLYVFDIGEITENDLHVEQRPEA